MLSIRGKNGASLVLVDEKGDRPEFEEIVESEVSSFQYKYLPRNTNYCLSGH